MSEREPPTTQRRRAALTVLNRGRLAELTEWFELEVKDRRLRLALLEQLLRDEIGKREKRKRAKARSELDQCSTRGGDTRIEPRPRTYPGG